MYDHSMFGVRVRTNVPLPGSDGVPAVDGADVVIELAGVGDPSSMPATAPSDPTARQTHFTPVADADGNRYVRIRYAGRGHEAVFLVDAAGRHVWARWNALVGLADVAALVSGPILVCVLRLRGLTCLHASVLAVGGGAIALLGAKGAGKSTTALALVRRGARLLADDVAVIDRVGDGYTVRAGQARLRMRPAAAEALCESFDALRPLWSREDERPAKRYFDVGSADRPADGGRTPLTAVYVLGARADAAHHAVTRVRAIGAASSLPTLMANRHMADVVDRAGHARDFAVLADVARHVPLRDVERVEGLGHLADAADAILADVASLGHASPRVCVGA